MTAPATPAAPPRRRRRRRSRRRAPSRRRPRAAAACSAAGAARSPVLLPLRALGWVAAGVAAGWPSTDVAGHRHRAADRRAGRRGRRGVAAGHAAGPRRRRRRRATASRELAAGRRGRASRRAWPGTLRLDVTERDAGRRRRCGAAASRLRRRRRRAPSPPSRRCPPGAGPRSRSTAPGPDDPATRAALQVLADLPAGAARRRSRIVRADVARRRCRCSLRDGRAGRLGRARATPPTKAAAALALLRMPGSVVRRQRPGTSSSPSADARRTDHPIGVRRQGRQPGRPGEHH